MTIKTFLRGPELVGEPKLSTELFLDQSGQGLVGSGGVALSKRILTSLAPRQPPPIPTSPIDEHDTQKCLQSELYSMKSSNEDETAAW